MRRKVIDKLYRLTQHNSHKILQHDVYELFSGVSWQRQYTHVKLSLQMLYVYVILRICTTRHIVVQLRMTAGKTVINGSKFLIMQVPNKLSNSH